MLSSGKQISSIIDIHEQKLRIDIRFSTSSLGLGLKEIPGKHLDVVVVGWTLTVGRKTDFQVILWTHVDYEC